MRSQVEVPKELARYHREVDPNTVAVKFFPNGNTIHLLEVSRGAHDLNEILPFSFAADHAEEIDLSTGQN